MKRLIFIREVYQRIVRDQRILRSNPNTLETKFTRLAIKMLRNASKDEDPKERFEKMSEIANQVFEGLSDAIEELERDE